MRLLRRVSRRSTLRASRGAALGATACYATLPKVGARVDGARVRRHRCEVMTHANMLKEDRLKVGITDGFIRASRLAALPESRRGTKI